MDANQENLFNNILHTEADIVIGTSRHLFIGEAKDESKFDKNPKYVLPHQLIRQYVMAKILVCHAKEPRQVVPFVVGKDQDNLKNFHDQVKFMVEQGRSKQGWLKEGNVLSWQDIKGLAK